MSIETVVVSQDEKNKYRQKLLSIGDEKIGKELFYLIKSRYRTLYIRSHEENRVIEAFSLMSRIEGYDLFQWDCSRGLLNAFDKTQVVSGSNEIHENMEALLRYIIDQAKSDNESSKQSGGHIYILLDCHHYIKDSPTVERLFKQFSGFSSISHIVIVSPIYVDSPSLEKEFTLVDFPPPSRHEIKESFDRICTKISAKFPSSRESAKKNEEEIIKAATGLTIAETENAYAKSLVKMKAFDIPTILEEKKQLIRKGGILEYRDSRFTFDQIGGLSAIKEWLSLRKLAFKEEAREYGLDVPKGLLILGIPGCVLGDTKIRVKSTVDNKEEEIEIEHFFGICSDCKDYQIDTPEGWQDIDCLIKKKNKNCYNLVIDDNPDLGCSCDHYIQTFYRDMGEDTYEWKTAEEINIWNFVVTRNGNKKVIAKEFLGKRDTFDLSIKNKEHRYYSNDVVSHNTGKSMLCDALAGFYKMPLLRLDMGSIFSSHVGDSEKNMRDVISLAEAISPCTLWADEIEKGIGGVQSSNMTDGGVTNRVFGTLLTWLQEKEKLVFVVCTANNIMGIPPEFMRAGRFDEIFFVDLPNKDQRREVISVLLIRKNRDPDKFDLSAISETSDNYSPAEIEKGINNAMFVAYSEKREVNTKDVVSELGKFKPLYESRKEEILEMREWALGKDGVGGRARLANSVSDIKNYAHKDTGRAIDLSEADL